jgi:hypothetical protein
MNVSERLSVWARWEGCERTGHDPAKPIPKNRLSGVIGGLAETWTRVKAHNAETDKPLPKVARAAFLSRLVDS